MTANDAERSGVFARECQQLKATTVVARDHATRTVCVASWDRLGPALRTAGAFSSSPCSRSSPLPARLLALVLGVPSDLRSELKN